MLMPVMQFDNFSGLNVPFFPDFTFACQLLSNLSGSSFHHPLTVSSLLLGLDLLLVLIQVVLRHVAEGVGLVVGLVDDGVVLVVSLDDTLGGRANHDHLVTCAA